MYSSNFGSAGNGYGGLALSGVGMSGGLEIGGQYSSLRRRAALGQLLSRITGRSRSLRSLSEAMDGYRLCGQRHAGVQTVTIDRIVGSEGRCNDFDRDFRPLQTHTQHRWLSVARARSRGITLPAVDLIRVGDEYYVRDGHHRISVAQTLGQAAIDATVTEYHVVPRPTREVKTPSAAVMTGARAIAAAG